MKKLLESLRQFAQLVKLEHTIFALPFALISMLLASRNLPHGLPPLRVVVLILGAMVGARSAAMSFNRLIDAGIDAKNPRTANRHIPAGLISPKKATGYLIVSILLFVAASWGLNWKCGLLAPVALAVVLGYSVTKRFTPFCHLVLGFGIGIAPIGAWLAVTGDISLISLLLGALVMLWIGGFDIIYALQDDEFDKREGLRSIPQTIGRRAALNVSRLLHTGAIVLLFVIGHLAGLGTIYFVGAAIVAGLLIYEQSIVKPNDLSRVDLAFFTLNGWVSILFFLFTAADGLMQGRLMR